MILTEIKGGKCPKVMNCDFSCLNCPYQLKDIKDFRAKFELLKKKEYRVKKQKQYNLNAKKRRIEKAKQQWKQNREKCKDLDLKILNALEIKDMSRKELMNDIGYCWTTLYDHLKKLLDNDKVSKYKKKIIQGQGRSRIFWRLNKCV